jgi:nitrite reductase/ring-hydroxylating ferredoxin subunit
VTASHANDGPGGVRLGPAADLAVDEGRAFAAGGDMVTVFRLHTGEILAVSAACPHAGGPIADGLVDAEVVICPLHQHVFDLATGLLADRPAAVAGLPGSRRRRRADRPYWTVIPPGGTMAEPTTLDRVAVPETRGHWIAQWAPEDPLFWNTGGRTTARRNLIFSILAEHIGFSVWLLGSIVVVRLGAAGWDLTVSQALWLTAVPSGVGAFLRLPYMFAVPVFGGRNWTVVSAPLLILPCAGLAWLLSTRRSATARCS